MAKKILVIDDAQSIRQVVKLVLQEKGYEVIEAMNGKEAIELLDGRNIDCLVCDINMPEMNGIAFLEKLKSDESLALYKFTPCIMLTTESSHDLKEKGKELGARVWLVKPFQPDELLSSVEKLMMQ